MNDAAESSVVRALFMGDKKSLNVRTMVGERLARGAGLFFADLAVSGPNP